MGTFAAVPLPNNRLLGVDNSMPLSMLPPSSRLPQSTGKQQSITIQSSGGLSEQQIQQMVGDAEKYAAKDAERKAAIEAKNEADTLIYSGGPRFPLPSRVRFWKDKPAAQCGSMAASASSLCASRGAVSHTAPSHRTSINLRLPPFTTLTLGPFPLQLRRACLSTRSACRRPWWTTLRPPLRTCAA